MPLVFIMNYGRCGRESASAYAIVDLARGRCTELCRIFPMAQADGARWSNFDTLMVGTCNGLLCLCEDNKPGGAITLVSPLTGEAMDVPPVPAADSGYWARWEKMATSAWHDAYTLGYEPTTRQYKASSSSSSWRDVPVPAGAIRSPRNTAGVISVDGAAYWISNDWRSVVSFSLKEERVMFAVELPVNELPGRRWVMTEVHGKPGIVSELDLVTESTAVPENNEALVLDDDGGGEGDNNNAGGHQRRWKRQYSVEVDGRSCGLELARPHFVHGDYFLTSMTIVGKKVFAQKPRSNDLWWRGKVRTVQLREKMPPRVEMSGLSGGYIRGMFSYAHRLSCMGLPWCKWVQSQVGHFIKFVK
ncbi:hypothetical protein PR202_gb02798 [Eleusine coracana subsp. coracana]|uniref:Uncharacterized protein n=1 Tax=Eleusine coracana subsp. coracana TaxID=191504 RepID=A0AAV5DXR0_ELECO|nr:hypothetical protein QOZ80_8BG0664510 [Eleusine coracana subsp. coracana]GJN15854.1 hypothetical protein PR202_gb02798 [Eleusine coracana subsp. coracana]